MENHGEKFQNFHWKIILKIKFYFEKQSKNLKFSLENHSKNFKNFIGKSK